VNVLTGRYPSPANTLGVPNTFPDHTSFHTTGSVADDPASAYESSVNGPELGRIASNMGTNTAAGDDDDDDDDEDEYGDDSSSREIKPHSKDAFNITAQSAKLQLDLLTSVSAALDMERNKSPNLPISDPLMLQAFASYESAIGNLKGLIGDLLRISRDRDAYWQYRLDREANVRRMWEESMAQVAKEQEQLETRIGESEQKRRKTKKALREALEDFDMGASGLAIKDDDDDFVEAAEDAEQQRELASKSKSSVKVKRKATFADIAAELTESDSEDDEEFFDAVGAGEIEVVEMTASAPVVSGVGASISSDDLFERKHAEIATAWAGYEDGPRERLAMDADDRPKISLWVRPESLKGRRCILTPY